MKPEITTPIDRNADRLAELLPWYENGSLSADDHAWVEAQLADDPAAGKALAFDRQIAETLSAQADELPADIGWNNLMQRVRADAAPAAATAAERSGGLMDWLMSLLTPRVGMAMAVLLAVQTIGLGLLVNDRAADHGTVEYRSVGGVAPHPVIRAVFADDLTNEQMRDTLLDQGLVIVDGPNQLGEYQLMATQADLASLAEQLKTAGVLSRYAIDQRVMYRPSN